MDEESLGLTSMMMMMMKRRRMKAKYGHDEDW